MQTITLYRYTRDDGGTTVSTEKPDVEYTETIRLIADDGYMLTDGVAQTSCVDTDDPNVWSEVKNDEDADEVATTNYEDTSSKIRRRRRT